MTTKQTLVWTTLPTGVSSGHLRLSVYLSPQLSATTPAGAHFAPLSLFADFVDWPHTVSSGPSGPLAFTVNMANDPSSGVATATAEIVTPAPPHGVDASTAWTTLFPKATTAVDPWTFEDFSTRTINSFSASTVAQFVASMYGTIGATSPSDPITITSIRNQFGAAGTAGSIYTTLRDLAPAIRDAGDDDPDISVPTTPTDTIARLRSFHAPLPQSDFNGSYTPKVPTLDFHQGISGLADYPTVLRLFGLVFDLSVPIPDGLASGAVQIWVTPVWKSAPASSVDFTPKTAATLSSSSFRATPSGPDYANGMLGLNDASRFTVTGLDVDLAGDRLVGLSNTLQSQQRNLSIAAEGDSLAGAYYPSEGAQSAVTVPSLRSTGLSVLWSCYATAGAPSETVPLPPTDEQDPFGQLLSGQAAINAALTTWLSDPTTANLPILSAEQLIRGHRFDVYTNSDAHPAWRSLCGRVGTYSFGPHSSSPIKFKVSDEGTITPAASQRAGTTGPAPTDLYVHESVVRWAGWGLSAQRPGRQVTTETSGSAANRLQANPGNMPQPPSATGPSAPQLSAYFTPPSRSGEPTLVFPKLRFGNSYQFRARAVDLAGNSLPVTSSDASTASPLTTHLRYEPVRPPALAGVAPFTPGEATLYLFILDDDVHAPAANGRWLFPPKASESLVEEHGMLDGFVPGHAPSDSAPPNGNLTTYDAIKTAADATLADAATSFDKANHDVPYFALSAHPKTPWLPDPISSGPSLTGLPGVRGALTGKWAGTWPSAAPVLLRLAAGSAGAHYKAATGSAPATFDVTLPKAESALVRISSALPASALGLLGVYKWSIAVGGDASTLAPLAESGQMWLLSPFQVMRMVHAVRLPLVKPALGSPETYRDAGATSVNITDTQFAVDEKSTSHVDVLASWTDPYDNPADPSSNPANPAKNTRTSSGPAFRLTVPDPNPTGPDAQPLTTVAAPETFSFGSDFLDYTESATHHIGDTLHHTINYAATGTSRFADLFQDSLATSMSAHHAVTIGTAALGVQAHTVTVTITFRYRKGGRIDTTHEQLVEGTDFTVDTTARTVTLLHGFGNLGATSWHAVITWQPVTTVTGPAKPVEVLSSATPKPPVVSAVVPAWQLAGPTGSANDGITVTRTGGFLRVYLERPWYSSGAGEMLGVVTTVTAQTDTTSTMPTTAQQAFVTMMGLDPINYMQGDTGPWPVVPVKFAGLGQVPTVPYRPPYASPPQVYLTEDDTQPYQVWPYDVSYDPATQRWFADVAPRPGITQEGTYPPPPGYFIRLALVRFQPWSQAYSQGNTVEVSPVVTATIAQPVPDRSVTVIAGGNGRSVYVTVTGPAYGGWRPPGNLPQPSSTEHLEYDLNNVFAPQNASIYGGPPEGAGSLHTSTVVVEVQVQDEVLNKMGFTGDLGWKTEPSTAPVRLPATFAEDGSVNVTWGGSGTDGEISLPDALTSGTKMRLRVSELDYYQGTAAPTTVDTNYRRPFVSLIPLN